VLVVNRFIISDPDVAQFEQRVGAALEALSVRPGYVRGELGRAYDDPTHWSLVTEWESVGAYRRALGGLEVKMFATPLLAQSEDEPSAFEILLAADTDGKITRSTSDRAADTSRQIDSLS
jgi:heme oxygenase (mycobilin-producing)